MGNKYQRLVLERKGAILTIKLSSPEKRNAVDAFMHAELPQALREAALDRTIGAIVLTGDPAGRAFCAGGDLEWIRVLSEGTGDDYGVVMREGVEVLRAMIDAPQPIISMINGAAMGLGATLGLFADVSFMDENAKIADSHVSVGVAAGDGGAVIWPLLIGPNRAKEYLMTGDPLTGKQAAEMGLVNYAVPAAELEAKTYAFAERMANGPRLGIEMTKRSVNLYLRMILNQVIDASLGLEGITFRTDNHKEAVRAFKAKEKPNFKNP
ncbi:MAG: enoyl-CoA hydratase-related protein [Rugosibacter sp.]|jgi:enoyl-CoA hydratase|nr:enoyl-CoA hydratase [Rugosibacter sp.]